MKSEMLTRTISTLRCAVGDETLAVVDFIEMPEKEFVLIMNELSNCINGICLVYIYDEANHMHTIRSEIGDIELTFCWENGMTTFYNIRKLITDLEKERWRCMTPISNPDDADILQFMQAWHPDRIRICKGDWCLTACGDIKLGYMGFDIRTKEEIAPTKVLTKYLGYPEELAARALMGEERAVEEFHRYPGSDWVPYEAVKSVNQTYHEIKEFDEKDKLSWISNSVWKTMHIRIIGSELLSINGNGDYIEVIDTAHLNSERSRYAIDNSCYLKYVPDLSQSITECYIVSSVVDVLRLVTFFDTIDLLAGKCFISIGSSYRVEAALRAIEDMESSRATIYMGLTNRHSRTTTRIVQERYPDVVDLRIRKNELGDIDFDMDEVAKMVPKKYQEEYFRLRKLKPQKKACEQNRFY